MLRIPKLQGSDTGLEIGYPDISCFSSNICQDSTLK